jgi:3-hydroxyisobutyrate dehydrogenase-like beta-hydroxyacid dehydrogenase
MSHEETTLKVGMIGLGAMGGAMVRRLLEQGVEVHVVDIDAGRVAAVAKLGAQPHDSPAQVAGSVEVTLISLPTSAIVEGVVLGDDGVLAAHRSGSVLVDMSSSDPDSTVALAAQCAEAGVAFLDAPVSRGARAAREGTLSILVGGPADELERVRPVLDLLGTDVVHVGRVGSGHAAKALNNHLSATALLAAIEGMLLAVRAGVDPELAVQAINQGSGSSQMTQVRFPRYYLPRRFDSDFALGLMHKDCRIAAEMSERSGRPMLLGSLTSQLYGVAMNKGMATADNTRILELMEGLSGLRLDEKSQPN